MTTIKVYSKPACAQCSLTISALKKAGRDFEVIDVTQDPDALATVLAYDYRSVPVVVVGPDHS